MASGIEPSGIDAAAGSRWTPVGRTVCPSVTPARPDDGGVLELGERHDVSVNTNAEVPIRIASVFRPPATARSNAKICFKFSPVFGV